MSREVRRLADGYADSTIVALAEELDSNLVFTTDRRDFEVYRVGRRRFRVHPD